MLDAVSHRLENLAGALSAAITDRVNDAAEKVAGMGGEAPAAIVQIGTMPNLTITTLGAALGLTHSATVRVVAKLERAKLVRKQRGEDAREVCVTLTASGERMMRKILGARDNVIGKIMKPLSVDERSGLTGLLETVLRRVAGDDDEAMRICRMCDENCCRGEGCPVTTYS
jgi:MarR family transcriptional regulator, negative regulator of the multidrug operon emrRAB